MKINIFFLFLSLLIIPISFILNLFSYQAISLVFLLKLLQTGLFITFIYLVGRWDWFSFYLRYIFLLLLLVILFNTYKLSFHQYTLIVPGNLSEYIINIFINLLFFVFLLKAIVGRKTKESHIVCGFPLKSGNYYIAHGGASKILNHHYVISSHKYALDILKLNNFGFRCKGIYPKKLDRYFIFGEPVYAPKGGIVTKVINEFGDLIPPEKDEVNKFGNHIVINIGKDIYILLAHLMKGSILVKEGEKVSQGQMIGKVGNSGNTTEPHLHIHCVKTINDDYLKESDGMPMLFNGKFLIRNNLMRM